MKTNLSSQITLTRIPLRYYRPENAFVHSVLTRLEKIPTNIYESAEEGSFAIAKEIATQIRKKQDIGKPFVIALPGGRSPLSVYKELIRMHKEENLSFRNVIAFVEYEFYPLANPSAGNLARLKEELFDQVDIDPANIYCPDGSMPKDAILDFCRQYEETIQSVGGIDCMLLGIGNSSNIMFNVGGTTISSRTRMVLLEGASRKEAARTFPSQENVPAGIITMGISTMMNARSVILMAWGEDKASIVAKTVEGKVSDAVPSSYLQNHPNAKVVIDLSAAYDLTRISHPWLVTSCEWDNKLIRRAIVWLCQLTDKPILKLTNKDYSEHGLGELLALYGSAYNVNIKIFNDIQHTITGWPGGKPNADDSNRPERANPYPKKVIVFSPHPDDDVISMGGTLRRLCDQHHDVHVAYETSGNIAVGDEEDEGKTRKKSDKNMNNYRKIVIADDSEQERQYKSDYRGRVQDRNVTIKPEPLFALTYYEKMSDVKRSVNYHTFIDELNQSGIFPKRLRITNMEAPLTEEQVKFHFALIDAHTSAIVEDEKSAAKRFARALDFYLVQDFASSMDDLTQAILLDDKFFPAYFMRSLVRCKQLEYQKAEEAANAKQGGDGSKEIGAIDYDVVKADLDKVITLAPDFSTL